MPDESLTVTKGIPNPYTSGPRPDTPTGQPAAGPPEQKNHLRNAANLTQNITAVRVLKDGFTPAKAVASVSAAVPPPAPTVLPAITPVSASPVLNVAAVDDAAVATGRAFQTTVATTSDLANGATTVADEAAQASAKAASALSRTPAGTVISKLGAAVPSVGTTVKGAGTALRAAGPTLSVVGAGLAVYDIAQDFQKEDKTDAKINLGLSLAGALAGIAVACLIATGPIGWIALGLAACTGFGLGNLAANFGGKSLLKGTSNAASGFWSWLTA